MREIKPELILPGGDLERVKTAFEYGADAVYVGLNKHSLRKAEVRFDIPEIGEAIEHAHSHGKRLFVTFNIFAHNGQLKDIEQDMRAIAKFKPDAFIISDVGVVQIAKRVAPHVPIHVSTQANTVNIEDVKFWASQGVKRIVLARELTLSEIKEIHKAVPEMELEIFVHGSMCISYSGRCLMSNYMTGRNANLGECTQPCRWNYKFYAEEQLRPGELFEIEESETGTAFMSSKDLRLVRYLPEIIDAGVTGLKIEGRNKTPYYVAETAFVYSTVLRLFEQNSYSERKKDIFEKELEKINYREYTTGFLLSEARRGETYPKREPVRKWDFVGQVTKVNGKTHEIIVKNQIKTGDEIEILTTSGVNKDIVQSILNEKNNEVDVVNPGKTGQTATLSLNNYFPANSFLRKIHK